MNKPLWIFGGFLGLVGVTGYIMLVPTELDTGHVEHAVERYVEDHIGPVDTVTCPHVEMKADNNFECEVRFTGGRIEKIAVEQGSPAVIYPVKPILGGAWLGKFIASELHLPETKIDCGRGIVEIPAAGLTCTGTRGDSHSRFLVVAGARGHLKMKELP